MNTRLLALSVAIGASMCAPAILADVVALPAATQQVLQTYPGTRVHMDQGRVRIIYGAPMTPGISAEAAAATWLEQHGSALGCPDPDLRLDWSATFEDGKFTVFAFQQFLDDAPVEAGIARILVLNRPFPRVVYAAGTLTPSTPQDLGEPMLDGPTAVALVRAQRLYHNLPKWTEPEMAVFQGIGTWQPPQRVWRFVGEDPDVNNRQIWTFFVSATTGNVVHIRNEILYNDITGTVTGRASPGTLPNIPANPAQLMPIGDIRLSIFNGTADFANPDGTFSLPHFGVDPVTMRVRLGTLFNAGRWVSVADESGPVLELSAVVTPPGPANFVFNNAAAAAGVAQVNAFIHVNKINEFFRSRAGTWAGLNSTIRANVNLAQTCNAFYGGGSVNFFAAGGGCRNTAYSSVIAHEYGHHIVNRLGLGQGGFGEGFSDVCSMLLYDDPIVGRGFFDDNSAVRAPLTANVQYPCTLGAIHDCGQILAAAFYRIRNNMGTFYGSGDGLARTQQLFVSWALITTGGEGPSLFNSAHPGTAIEVLTVNDDDGDLSNGTPDLPRICPAFAAHSIPCPTAAAVKWVFPAELPSRLEPGQATVINANVLPMGSTPTDNTGRLFYRVNGGTWVQVNMTRLAAHQYQGTIPAQTCGAIVDYYFTVNVPILGAVPYPSMAPQRPIFAPVAQSVAVVFADDFEEDRGWTAGDPSDTAITGHWTRDIPQPTGAQPGDVRTPGGVKCWVTDYRAGVQVSDYDVDGGKTTLISPLIDLTGRDTPFVTFWAWYSNNVGPVNPGTNIFEIEVTADDGASWFPVFVLGPDTDESRGGWLQYRFRIEDYVPVTSNFRIRFIASDYTGSIVEAAIDNFSINAINCAPPPSHTCYANCDGSTSEPVLNIDDFVCFITRFAAGDPWANCDGSTSEPILNIDDFVCFISAYAAGCP